jgi:hypothetical protein
MKIQCSCGAKYAFEVSPEMAQTPVRFVCPACGLDASDFVNDMVRQELDLTEPAYATSAPAPAPSGPTQRCLRHPGQFTTGKCFICAKPICPRCMELFGYVCSPLCRGKAEAQGIAIPVYAGQKSVAEARVWRRTVRVSASLCVLAVTVLGLWCWYEWFGSRLGLPGQFASPSLPIPANPRSAARTRLFFSTGTFWRGTI